MNNLRPITKQALADKYEVSRKTLIGWCKRLGIDLGLSKIVMPDQLRLIYKEIGEPEEKEKK